MAILENTLPGSTVTNLPFKKQIIFFVEKQIIKNIIVFRANILSKASKYGIKDGHLGLKKKKKILSGNKVAALMGIMGGKKLKKK